jgi:drug/metabolite transporter (DMT)-like permease
MDDKQKMAFWEVKSRSDERLWFVLFVVIAGIALSLAALSQDPGVLVSVIGAIVVIASAAVAKAPVGTDYKPPEPTLELIDEKYKAKATGADGIDALTLIAAFKEQEHVKAERLLIFIGAGFGVMAIAIGVFSEPIIPMMISSGFAVLFIAWARNVRNVRLKGFGIEVTTSASNKKSR